MNSFLKKLLAAWIAVMISILTVPTCVFARTAPTTEEQTQTVADTFYYQRDAKWGYGRAGYSACYLSSFAMILTNMGKENATPADLYKTNNRSTYMIQSRITGKYSVNWERISVSGKSKDSKINLVKQLLSENPQGVIVRNSGHTMIATHVSSNGNIIFNDPAYPNGYSLSMSNTQLGSWNSISYIEILK